MVQTKGRDDNCIKDYIKTYFEDKPVWELVNSFVSIASSQLGVAEYKVMECLYALIQDNELDESPPFIGPKIEPILSYNQRIRKMQENSPYTTAGKPNDTNKIR